MGMTLERFAAQTTQCQNGSIEATLETMYSDESMLRAADQHHIADFLIMYATATADVLQRRDNDEFDEPEQLERSVCDFEYRFKEPLLHLTAGDTDKIRPAWRPLLLNPAARTVPAINRQMAGMIAHIEADLPESAVSSGAIHNKVYMGADWDLVNTSLRTAAYTVSERSIVVPKIARSIAPSVRRMITDLGMDVIEQKRDLARVDAYKLNEAADQAARVVLITTLDKDAESHANAMLRGTWPMARHFLRALI